VKALALAALAGCLACRDVRPKRCDEVVLGACVASQAGRYDRAALERQLTLALQYWKAPPDLLRGWAIVFTPDPVPCPRSPGSGCTWWDGNRTIQVQVLDARCPETAQLVHELGHVLHHDPWHWGGWWSWRGEQVATWKIVRGPGASPGCAATRFYDREPAAPPS
jgi:hypothetical protein